VLQRVERAELRVLDAGVARTHASIGRGLVALVGIAQGDTEKDRDWTAGKIAQVRCFEDEAGKMNLSLAEIGGSVLLVPNFTVAGSAQKGRRPDFGGAMPPAEARAMFASLAVVLEGLGTSVRTGVFGADMRVELVNDGPVTLVIDSRG
jgi:D-tyrosyl-tRNA(Tyr) deacylase